MKSVAMLIVFKGHGEPIGHAKGFVESRAEGQILSAEGLDAPCAEAQFRTVVAATSSGNWEAGRVEFPAIDSWLDVDTPSPGQAQDKADGTSTGTIIWRVLDGGGLFVGATGYVTGNFTASPDGSFVDHQLFKLFVPA